MALENESYSIDKQIDAKDHFADLQRKMVLEGINRQLIKEISLNKIITKDLQQFSVEMIEFGTMTDKSKISVEKLLNENRKVLSGIKSTTDAEKQHELQIDKTRKTTDNLNKSIKSGSSLISEETTNVSNLADEMQRAADEASRYSENLVNGMEGIKSISDTSRPNSDTAKPNLIKDVTKEDMEAVHELVDVINNIYDPVVDVKEKLSNSEDQGRGMKAAAEVQKQSFGSLNPRGGTGFFSPEQLEKMKLEQSDMGYLPDLLIEVAEYTEKLDNLDQTKNTNPQLTRKQQDQQDFQDIANFSGMQMLNGLMTMDETYEVNGVKPEWEKLREDIANLKQKELQDKEDEARRSSRHIKLQTMLDEGRLNKGGYISGKKGIDMIPAMLSHGEFVINADATKKFLPLLTKINSGEIKSFNEGGVVSNSTTDQIQNQLAFENLINNSLTSGGYGEFRDKLTRNPDEFAVQTTGLKMGERMKDIDGNDVFAEYNSDVLENVVNPYIENFFTQKFKSGEDLTNKSVDDFFDEMRPQVVDLARAFETLKAATDTQIREETKAQGLDLEEGEVVGMNADRERIISEAMQEQANAINQLTTGGAFGEDFDFASFKTDKLRDSLLKDINTDSLAGMSIAEGLAKMNENEIRNLIGETLSATDAIRINELAKDQKKEDQQTFGFVDLIKRESSDRKFALKHPAEIGEANPMGAYLDAIDKQDAKDAYDQETDSYVTAMGKKIMEIGRPPIEEAHEQVGKDLGEIFSSITETFNLARDSIKDSLDSISEYAINSKKELDDLFQSGGFSDVNIKDKIKELDEQILEAQAVHSSTMDSLSFLSNIKTDSFGTETFDSFVNSITNTGSEEQNAMALAEKVNNMTNNMNAKQNIASQLQTSITNSEKLNNIKMSTGGFVSGPMGKDVIPAMLTDGEFVIRADVAKNWRGFLEYLNETGHLGMYNGGPVKLAMGGSPGGGGGSSGSPGGAGGGIPSIESQQADLLKYNSELMSQERIYTELVMYSKELAESGESAVSIQEKLNAKKEILLNQLREEEALSSATLRELQEQRDLLVAMDRFKLSGFYDGLIGAFNAVEQKIEGILNSVPFVGSLMATSLKTVTGPVFDELRGGFKTGFKASLDELQNQMGNDETGGLNPFDPDKLEVDKLMDAFTGQFSQAMTNAKNMLQGAIGLAKAFGPALMTVVLPLVVIGGLLAMAVSRFFELEEQAEEFRKGLGLMASTAKPIENIARQVQTEFALAGVELETAFNAATALTSQLGTTHLVTKEAVKTIALMEAGLGISAETAAGALDTFRNMGDSSGASAENMMMATAALADAAGVPLDAVMSDIANASEDTMKFMKGNAKEMMLAAVQARRLGVSMDSITGAMSKALDIESSITDEMRLASMMGQHISLDAMRRASFEGDAEQVMQEQLKALKQMGGTDAMNPYQLEAAANALGLSVDEMVKMERHEKGLQDLKNGTAEQQAMYNKYTEMQNKLQEEGVKSAAEEAEERIKQQQAELVKANIMRQVNAIMTKLAETLLPMVETGFKILMPILDSIFSVIGFILDAVGFLLKPITLVAEGITYIYDNFGKFPGILATILTGIVALKVASLALGASMGNIFTGMLSGAKKAFSVVGGGLKKMMGFGGAESSKGTGESGGIKDKIKGMFGGGDKSKGGDMVPDVDPKKGDKFKKFLDAFNKIDMSKIIKASAALLILSGALFVSAKAFQAFSKVSWDGVAKGILGLTALVVAAKFLEKGSTSMIKGAAAIAVLGIALIPAAFAFQMFSDVNWGGVLAGMLALGLLAVMAVVLGNLIVPIAMGAAAIALLGLALIPFGVAAIMAGAGMYLIGEGLKVMVESLQMLTFEDIGKIALLGYTFAGLGIMIPFILLGAVALSAMSGALLAFGVSAMIAGYGVTLLAAGFSILSESISSINEQGILVLFSLGAIGLLAPLFFVAAGGIVALAGAIAIMSAALVGASIMSIFSSDDPFAMYINLGENADKLNTAAQGLKNIATSMSALSDVDAEDILEDIADGMEDLFDEIEDIDPSAITKFTSIGVNFKYIGEGMDSIKKGISPFKDLLAVLNDPSNFEGAIIGINALTSAMYDLCKVMELIGEKDISILQQTTQPGAVTGDLASATVPVDTTVLAEGSNAEGAPSAEQMAQGGVDAPATAMAEVVQQVASVPSAVTSGGGAESTGGVEAKLDELISLMKSGKIGVSMDGKKVEKTLARAAP